jgi:hypothetical protein
VVSYGHLFSQIESNIIEFSVVAGPMEDFRLLFLLPFFREACSRSALPGYLLCLVVGALADVLRRTIISSNLYEPRFMPFPQKREKR